MLELSPATFEDFERQAQRGNVVPVVRSVLADLQTPVGAFLRIAENSPYAFLLESIEGGERVARYSFLGAKPWMIARGLGPQTIVEARGKRVVHDQNAIEFLRQYFRDKKFARRTGLAPSGGCFRFLDETAHAALLRGKVSRQNLQCDFPIEFCVLGQVHLTHPTGPDLGNDCVVRERCVGGN